MKNKKEQNNIVDLIKYIAAITVILSHSHSLSNLSKDILSKNIPGASLGSLAVAIFFSFSGYYIMKSIMKKGDKNFLKKRAKRILPELMIVVLLTIFIVGPIFTNIALKEYFFNPKTYIYLLNSIMIPYHNLPGVFANNIYGSTVNGALWTIPVEFACYIMLFICYKLNFKSAKKMMILFIVSIICYFSLYHFKSSFLITTTRPIIIFIFSALLFFIDNKSNKQPIIFSIIGIILLCMKNSICYDLFLIICLPIILVYISKNILVKNKIFELLGKISYSIYLVGFVIQQSIISIYGGKMNPNLNFILSALCATIIGFIINYFYEKKLKKLVDKI